MALFDNSKSKSVSDVMSLELYRTFDDAEQVWRDLDKTGVASAFQTFDWSKAWWSAIGLQTNAALAIVAGKDPSGKPLFLLPLMVERKGPLAVAKALGDRHSAYLGAMFSAEGLDVASTLKAGQLADAVGRTAGADVLSLACQASHISGRANPFLHQSKSVGRGESLSVSHIGTDWDAFDQAHRNGETRRKERKAENNLAKMGAVEFVVAETAEQRRELFNALKAQKSAWLQAHGLRDFFAGAAEHDFLARVSRMEHSASNAYGMLSGLSVAGELVAVTFGVVHRGTYAGLIMSVGNGPALKHSPGSLLLTRTMRYCAENGIGTFGFGAVAGGKGSDWKRRWCDETIEMADTAFPITMKGAAYAVAASTSAKITARIRSDARLLDLARSARSLILKTRDTLQAPNNLAIAAQTN